MTSPLLKSLDHSSSMPCSNRTLLSTASCINIMNGFVYKNLNITKKIYSIIIIMILKHEFNEVSYVLLIQKQPSRRYFKISVLFFQEQPFYNFPGESIYSLKRHVFSRKQTCFFQGSFICSSNRPYYFIEQILISQKPLFSPRTHTNFPRASIFSSNRYQ